jgi:hypothetical protein
MLWSDELIADVNLIRFPDLTLFAEFVGASRRVHLLPKLKRTPPPKWLVTADVSFPREWKSIIVTGWSAQNSSPLNRIYSLVLVRTNENNVTLTKKVFLPHCAPSPSGPTPTGWTPLDLTCGDKNCLVLRFWLQTPQKNSKVPKWSSVILLYSQLILLFAGKREYLSSN